MSEFYLIKTPTGWQEATLEDKESTNAYKIGDEIRVKAQKPRNPHFHRKGIALLRLGFDYWEPHTTLLTSGEKHMATTIADKLDALGGGTGVIVEHVQSIVREVEASRLANVGEVGKSFTAFRKDVTIRAGYCDVKRSPSGIIKIAKSISFSKMKEEEFRDLYKAIFNVLWNMVLSKHFNSEKEAEEAALKMLNFI